VKLSPIGQISRGSELFRSMATTPGPAPFKAKVQREGLQSTVATDCDQARKAETKVRVVRPRKIIAAQEPNVRLSDPAFPSVAPSQELDVVRWKLNAQLTLGFGHLDRPQTGTLPVSRSQAKERSVAHPASVSMPPSLRRVGMALGAAHAPRRINRLRRRCGWHPWAG
jgi:hypothetical protein